MSIVKSNPSAELDEIQGRMNRFFTDVPSRNEGCDVPVWAPSVDIQETAKEYAVTVDLPEMKKDDVKVGIENGTLTIEGERRLAKEHKDGTYHRIERQYGRFVRRFAMPGEIDAAGVQAQYKDGVLTVLLPKSAAGMLRSVEVKVA
jgi:HSP20 family protein